MQAKDLMGMAVEQQIAAEFIGVDPGSPDGDKTVIFTSTQTAGGALNDWLRERFQASRSESIGENAAHRVAYHVQRDLEQRYPDSVNARCVAMAGEEDRQGLLAVTWMRGREVFHRRYPIFALYVAQAGVGTIASVVLMKIHKHIDSTEGAERP